MDLLPSFKPRFLFRLRTRAAATLRRRLLKVAAGLDVDPGELVKGLKAPEQDETLKSR
jgi:hypothetical protein